MVAQIDLSGISYFLPILSFFVVFIVVFALLQKTKIFGNVWVQLFLSFLVSTIFVTFVGARIYVANVIPWFAVLLVCLFFILLITGFIGDKLVNFNKWIVIVFVVVLVIGFLVSAIFVFSSSLSPYLPGSSSYGQGANQDIIMLTNWVSSSRIAGAVLLLVISALVSWVLVSAKK